MNKLIVAFIIVGVISVGYYWFTTTDTPTPLTSVYTNGPHTFVSGSQQLQITYDQTADKARLDMNGASYYLSRGMSGSGTLYKGDGVVYREHAGEVMVEINGKTVIQNAKLQ